MKILVTGGKGFVGGYVTKELHKYGHEVTILSNLSHPAENTADLRFEYGDVRYAYDIDRVGKHDACIHLAAKINVDRSRENAESYVDINVKGTFNILEYCRKYGVKLIYAATSEALGTMLPEYSEKGMDETHPFLPDNPYGATKAAAEMLVRGWAKQYQIQCTILRSFNVCGVGQSYDKEGAFIPKVVNRIKNNQNPIIFGRGDQTRDYLYVGDLACAYRILVENENTKECETYHVGTGIETSIESIARLLILISGKDLSIDYTGSRPSEVRRLKCDYTKFYKAYGWRPTRTVQEVLSDYFRMG
jgi:nucleoside-diphosphate-sugar epimerase